jgi:hypothetical protein
VAVLPVRALVGLAVLASFGCGRDVGIVEITDVGFIESADTVGEDTVLGDASSSSCSVGALESCPADRLCCDLPEERCVPSADGVHHCAESGTVEAGDRCGDRGVDDCVFGALCASTRTDDRQLCRAICTTSSDCAAGTCVAELELGGETIRLCE